MWSGEDFVKFKKAGHPSRDFPSSGKITTGTEARLA